MAQEKLNRRRFLAAVGKGVVASSVAGSRCGLRTTNLPHLSHGRR